MEIVILFAFIVINGAFSMSEIALVTARKARLQRLVDEGDSSAIAAVKLGDDPTRFLSTIQIGITSIGVLNGIVGEAALVPPLAQWLMSLGLQDPYASYAGTALVVMLITYFSIVLGELVSKRLGQANPEAVARLVAKPINFLAMATKPFVRLLLGSTKGLLRLLGVKDTTGSNVTEDEIHAILAEGTSAGVIKSHEHTMVRNVFLLKDRLTLSSVPEEERGRYHTLSGIMMLLTGRLPKVADTIQWQDWKFEIVDMDGKTIDKVLASRISSAPLNATLEIVAA